MHYNWHRHYDPSTGRYTQPDPLGFVDGPSVYGYARQSPLVYVDPDGRLVLYGFGEGSVIFGGGGQFTIGSGLHWQSGGWDSFVHPSGGAGLDIGGGGGLGFFTGNWCNFSGWSNSANLSILGWGGSFSWNKDGFWGVSFGFTRGPAIPPFGFSLTIGYTFVGVSASNCSCN